MKIFLGNAPWNKSGFYGVRAGSRWPHFEHAQSEYMPFPFFLAYSSALLKREGFEVRLVDAIAAKLTSQEFLDDIVRFKPEVLVLEVSTISIKTDLDYAHQVRTLLGSDCTIVFCGLHTEMYQPAFLEQNPEIDLILIGEYEQTLLELVRSGLDRETLRSVPGIVYRDRAGQPHLTGPRPIMTDLDQLPWPDRDSVPMANYCDTPGQIPRPSVQMWASRGCPFQCIFCAWPQIMYGGHHYRTRDPIDVIDEMEWLVKEKGFRSVYFDDDTFNIGKPRILSMCSEIEKRRLNVPWAIMARADTMDQEMLLALKRAGLHALKYGVESAEQSLVDRAGKKLDLEKVRKIVRATQKLGIFIHLTFTFGLPGETKETIEKTIKLACELNPDSLQFSIITPFPGSKLYRELEQKGHLLSKNWEEYDGYNTAVIRTDTLTKQDLEQALHRALSTWEHHRFVQGLSTEPIKLLKRALKNPHGALQRLRRVFRTSWHQHFQE
ncbi:radical SAM protein [bacterium]|nr:radical SAM protein [bacterium]